eukprot:scaffold2716_cov64-Phaeocystis_antarctica.AAC.7
MAGPTSRAGSDRQTPQSKRRTGFAVHFATPPVQSLIVVHVGVGQRCRALDVESPTILPTVSTRNVPTGRWIHAQKKFKRRAHIVSLISVDVGVGQRCRASDVESSARLPTMSTRNVPTGRWKKGPGNVQKASAQILPRFGTRWCWSALPWHCPRCRAPRPPANHEHMQRSNGALDTRSEKVQKASTHRQPDYRRRWCWSALPYPRCRVPRHTANREHTQRSSGALDATSRNVQRASTPILHHFGTRWCWSALPCHLCGVPRHTANHEHTKPSMGHYAAGPWDTTLWDTTRVKMG